MTVADKVSLLKGIEAEANRDIAAPYRFRVENVDDDSSSGSSDAPAAVVQTIRGFPLNAGTQSFSMISPRPHSPMRTPLKTPEDQARILRANQVASRGSLMGQGRPSISKWYDAPDDPDTFVQDVGDFDISKNDSPGVSPPISPSHGGDARHPGRISLSTWWKEPGHGKPKELTKHEDSLSITEQVLEVASPTRRHSCPTRF